MTSITKDMTIGDIVARYPQVVNTLLKYGLHCVGCHVNAFETIEQGAQTHGMPSAVFEKMLEEANEVAKQLPQNSNKSSSIVSLSTSAVNKIKELRKSQGVEQMYFRIEVLPSGCSGLSYNFYFDDAVGDDDNVIECEGLKVIVDAESLPFLKGSSIDYVDSLQGAGLKVNNPNAKSGCGCGSSFGV